MKSWLSFFLHTDEYKENKIMQFLAEGSIILMMSLVILFIVNSYSQYHIDTKVALAIPLIIYFIYVLTRYIFSGLEYANVATKEDYKKEIRRLLFMNIFLIISSSIVFLLIPPRGMDNWIRLMEGVIGICILWLVGGSISLNRSYKKNKSLM